MSIKEKPKPLDITLKPDKKDVSNNQQDGVIHSAMIKDKPLTVDEERLKSIIRAEMERFLFDQVCDKGDEDTTSDKIAGSDTELNLDTFAANLPKMEEGETMQQADARRRKRWAKKREDYRKEIKKKQDQRHKYSLKVSLW